MSRLPFRLIGVKLMIVLTLASPTLADPPAARPAIDLHDVENSANLRGLLLERVAVGEAHSIDAQTKARIIDLLTQSHTTSAAIVNAARHDPAKVSDADAKLARENSDLIAKFAKILTEQQREECHGRVFLLTGQCLELQFIEDDGIEPFLTSLKDTLDLTEAQAVKAREILSDLKKKVKQAKEQEPKPEDADAAKDPAFESVLAAHTQLRELMTERQREKFDRDTVKE